MPMQTPLQLCQPTCQQIWIWPLCHPVMMNQMKMKLVVPPRQLTLCLPTAGKFRARWVAASPSPDAAAHQMQQFTLGLPALMMPSDADGVEQIRGRWHGSETSKANDVPWKNPKKLLSISARRSKTAFRSVFAKKAELQTIFENGVWQLEFEPERVSEGGVLKVRFVRGLMMEKEAHKQKHVWCCKGTLTLTCCLLVWKQALQLSTEPPDKCSFLVVF